ncbi:uncharacterized protein LOC108665098 [Hyalella azteca]|uniref:Uncharacterized protein LOC108665098 n=1 Tax=Hyalella azteca TaxID=294128 RepID=A0A8B7N265_HYAAZ|nr:uncharacterized protein LOC108665098 [Hyalella azteca]
MHWFAMLCFLLLPVTPNAFMISYLPPQNNIILSDALNLKQNIISSLNHHIVIERLSTNPSVNLASTTETTRDNASENAELQRIEFENSTTNTNTDATSPADPSDVGCEKNQTLGMKCTPYNSSSEEVLKCSGEGLLRTTLLFGMCLTMTVILVGGIGNGITILILIHQMILGQRQQQIRTTASSVLVLNLAIADLCYSVLCLPFVFSIYLIIFRSGLDLEAPLSHGFDTKCQFSAFFRYTNAISEWTTIGLMALERFITISRYARWQKGGYRWFTPKKSACYCLMIWIVGVGLQLPTLLEAGPFFGKFGYNTDTVKCDFVSDQPENFGMRDVFFLMEAPVPCVLILVGYIAIIVRIKSSTRFMKKFGTTACHMKIAMRNSKTTGLCFKLIFVYLVCVVPVCVWNGAIPEDELGKPCNQILGIYIYCFYWIQYAANNFIYARSIPRYSKAAKQLLHAVIPCYFRPDEHSFNLKKAPKRELVVSVISMEKCHNQDSVVKMSSSVKNSDEMTSDCEFSSNYYITLLFSSPSLRDECVNDSRISTGFTDDDSTLQSYLMTCQLRPKHSVYSEWSFTGDRPGSRPGNNSLVPTLPRRKRSSSDAGQVADSARNFQRKISF